MCGRALRDIPLSREKYFLVITKRQKMGSLTKQSAYDKGCSAFILAASIISSKVLDIFLTGRFGKALWGSGTLVQMQLIDIDLNCPILQNSHNDRLTRWTQGCSGKCALSIWVRFWAVGMWVRCELLLFGKSPLGAPERSWMRIPTHSGHL